MVCCHKKSFLSIFQRSGANPIFRRASGEMDLFFWRTPASAPEGSFPGAWCRAWIFFFNYMKSILNFSAAASCEGHSLFWWDWIISHGRNGKISKLWKKSNHDLKFLKIFLWRFWMLLRGIFDQSFTELQSGTQHFSEVIFYRLIRIF